MYTGLVFLMNVDPRSILVEDIPTAGVVTHLILAVLLMVAAFLLRSRSLKIFCACTSEVFLFLSCKMAFGPEAIVTQIMCWLTAAVVCILTVGIVNRINWNELRGRPGK
jgi:hypothetical protein